MVLACGLSDEQRSHCKSLAWKGKKTAGVVSINICIVCMRVIKMGIILLRVVFGIITIIKNGLCIGKTRSSYGLKFSCCVFTGAGDEQLELPFGTVDASAFTACSTWGGGATLGDDASSGMRREGDFEGRQAGLLPC